jgi:hydrogenase nickel incorporation protein HypA/HybF
MHELGITRNIVAIVAKACNGHKVTRVTLEIGKLSGVMADAVAYCFDAVTPGTALEGAALEIHAIDGRGRCQICGAEFATETLFTPCPCGSRRVTRLAGEELTVKSFEMETV